MKYEAGRLQARLKSARRRRPALVVLRAVAVCLAVGAVVLLLTGWGAYRYKGSEGALLALRVGALVALVGAAYLALLRPLTRRIGDVRLARFIEERARGTEERGGDAAGGGWCRRGCGRRGGRGLPLRGGGGVGGGGRGRAGPPPLPSSLTPSGRR